MLRERSLPDRSDTVSSPSGLAPLGRSAAAAIALVAWVGLAIQLQASVGESGSIGAAVWAMLRYFTILSNLLLALLFSAIARGSARAATPRLLGGMTLTILLVGAVYYLLLRGHAELNAGVALVGVLLHEVTPSATALFWLAFAPKGRLGRTDPLRWMALPLAYLAYALVRGAVDGAYPYPFIDVGTIGWGRTMANSAAIAAGFVVAGYVLVGVDRVLGQRKA